MTAPPEPVVVENGRLAQTGIVLSEIGEKMKLAYRIYRSEPVTIRMYGDEQTYAVYRAFTSGHRLVPWLAQKGFGAALIDLSDTASVTFMGTGRRHQLCRRRIRKAAAAGYSCRSIDALDHVDEILAINRSSYIRQDRAMDDVYLVTDAVLEAAARERLSFGVFDCTNVLRAYAHTPILGDAFAFSYILGDAAHLKNGVMYLLVQHILTSMRRRYDNDGFPRWAFYDMVLGAKPGLRQFKQQLGFKPYRVRWTWIHDAPDKRS